MAGLIVPQPPSLHNWGAITGLTGLKQPIGQPLCCTFLHHWTFYTILPHVSSLLKHRWQCHDKTQQHKFFLSFSHTFHRDGAIRKHLFLILATMFIINSTNVKLNNHKEFFFKVTTIRWDQIGGLAMIFYYTKKWMLSFCTVFIVIINRYKREHHLLLQQLSKGSFHPSGLKLPTETQQLKCWRTATRQDTSNNN